MIYQCRKHAAKHKKYLAVFKKTLIYNHQLQILLLIFIEILAHRLVVIIIIHIQLYVFVLIYTYYINTYVSAHSFA